MIYINNIKIKNNEYYTFPNKDTYNINYVFNKSLNSTNHMFFNCISLISLDLSNFNAQNVTDMSYMFFNCRSLIS